MNYELYHHGILGMKWGVRRYQNKDGSLTAAGKRRYAKALDTIKELDNESYNVRITRNSSGKQKMSLKEEAQSMTDEELNARVNRLIKEKQYVQFTKDLNPETKSWVKEALKNGASSGLQNATSEIMKSMIVDVSKSLKGTDKK